MQGPLDPSVRPSYATGFYPGDPASCLQGIEALLERIDLPSDLQGTVLGGLVPHAGWVYSGFTAACLWSVLAAAPEPPEVVVLLGAVHRSGVGCATVSAEDRWGTPLGSVEVDAVLRRTLRELAGERVIAGNEAHVGEHSLEVQLPFVRRLLPGTPILPVQVPADSRAPEVGQLLAQAIAHDGRRVVVIASSDLTHYGHRYGFAPAGTGPEALEYGRRNDQLLIDQALAMDPAGVLKEAREHYNACGSGALAAAISCSTERGADAATLLHYTTSHDSGPERARDPSMFVGYASMVFARG